MYTNKLNGLKNRLIRLKEKYNDIDEVQFMVGGKKKKFVFNNQNNIGYKGKKAMKIDCKAIELKIAEIIMNNPHKNLIKIYSVNKKKKK